MDGELDWSGVARLRQGLYRFFGAGLTGPDEDRVRALVAAAEILDASGIEHFAFATPWARLLSVIGDLPPVGDLEAEYVRLFVVGPGPTPCPPYESHYLGKPRHGDPAVIVGSLERKFRSLGLTLVPGNARTHDHAATELEVLSELCRDEHAAWCDGALADVARLQEAELDILEEHLGRWFGVFARHVSEQTRQPFYACLTETADAFLYHDRELLRVVVRAGRVEAVP